MPVSDRRLYLNIILHLHAVQYTNFNLSTSHFLNGVLHPRVLDMSPLKRSCRPPRPTLWYDNSPQCLGPQLKPVLKEQARNIALPGVKRQRKPTMRYDNSPHLLGPQLKPATKIKKRRKRRRRKMGQITEGEIIFFQCSFYFL